MNAFVNILRRIIGYGNALGGAFLVGMMVLIVASIVYRMFGHVVPGSLELSELMIVVTASFAIAYAGLVKSHVDVKILVEKFPERLQAILEVFTSFLAMGTWAIIAYASTIILVERWHTEESDMLMVPFSPFRTVLFIGLILVTLVYLVDMILALGKAVKK
jgi:TRAP-type C4-dicarboxylate transport system permease small subunit